MHWSLSLIVFSFPITSHWELNKNAPTVSYVYTSTHHSAWRSNHSETICCGEDLQTAANTIKQPRRPIQQFGSSDLALEFSYNPDQTQLNELIMVFRITSKITGNVKWVWSVFQLKSAGHQLSRTVFKKPWWRPSNNSEDHQTTVKSIKQQWRPSNNCEVHQTTVKAIKQL